MACLAYLVSLLATACLVAKADIVVYTDDVLASPWQDWSWSSTINYDATDLFEGTSSISVDSGDWAALSLYNPTPFPTAAGLEFDIAVSRTFLPCRISCVMIACYLGRQPGRLDHHTGHGRQHPVGNHSPLCIQYLYHCGQLHAYSLQLCQFSSKRRAYRMLHSFPN